MRVARYLALGDSYTIGEGVSDAERWPDQLVAHLRAQGVPIADPCYIARTAWTADELLDAILEARPRGPFDVVTLLVGVNDQYRARPLAAFAAGFKPTLAKAISLAGRRASRVIVVSMPDWGATPYAAGRGSASIARDIEAYNMYACSAAAEAGCAWVDVTTLSRGMTTEPSLVAADKLHPSAELYRRWAERIAPAALAALRVRPGPGAGT